VFLPLHLHLVGLPPRCHQAEDLHVQTLDPVAVRPVVRTTTASVVYASPPKLVLVMAANLSVDIARVVEISKYKPAEYLAIPSLISV
jgi:hypothetical protein